VIAATVRAGTPQGPRSGIPGMIAAPRLGNTITAAHLSMTTAAAVAAVGPGSDSSPRHHTHRLQPHLPPA